MLEIHSYQVAGEHATRARTDGIRHQYNIRPRKRRSREICHSCTAVPKIVKELLRISILHAIHNLRDRRLHELRITCQQPVAEIPVEAVEVLAVLILGRGSCVGEASCEIELAEHGGEAGVEVLAEERPDSDGAGVDVAASVAGLVDEDVLHACCFEFGEAGVECF